MMQSNRGRITARLSRQARLMLASQSMWLILLLGFCLWWGYLLRRLALRIAELEVATGVAGDVVAGNLDKLNRIIFWEAGTMVVLVLAISIFFVWLFFRDTRRTRSVQAFFAGVTHELRTPMTSIRLQAESLAEKTDPADPRRKLVDRLLEDAGQLESHLEQTLELARVEGGEPPQLQPIKLEECLQRFLRDWHYAHGVDNPSVQHDMGNTECLADPVAMQTILRNLFDNTLKHSGKPDACVCLRAVMYGQRVIVSYQDDGRGFTQDPGVLGKAFEKGPVSGGSGVGLYLVSALMQQMAGSATFASRHGFCAELDFPAAPPRTEVSRES